MITVVAEPQTVGAMLATLQIRERQIAAELDELRAEGVNVIPISPAELLLLELAGFAADLETGEIEQIGQETS